MLQDKVNRVVEICGSWGMYVAGNTTTEKQFIKALSEVGELADSILKNNKETAKDDIGDIAVCVINAMVLNYSHLVCKGKCMERALQYGLVESLASVGSHICQMICLSPLTDDYYELLDSLDYIAELLGLTLEECLDQSISVIEKRTGRFVDGTFIKDE